MTDLGGAFGMLGQAVVLGATIKVVDSSLGNLGRRRKKHKKNKLFKY